MSNNNNTVLVAYHCNLCKERSSYRLYGVFKTLNALKAAISEDIDNENENFECVYDFNEVRTYSGLDALVDFIAIEEVNLDEVQL